MATPFRQLESVTSYTADGVTTAWNFSFSSGYLDKAHVKAYQLSPLGARTDIPVTLGMFAGAYQLTISPAIQAGYELTIYRDTPTSVPLVDFTDAAAFTEVALDTVVKQAVFAAAETQDALSVASARIDQIGSFAQGAQDARTAALASQAAANQSAIDAATYAGQALASKNAAAASALSVVDSNLAHIAGNETFTGLKTFGGGLKVAAGQSVDFTSAPVTGLSKSAVGLGNVDNTADASKPVSTAQAAALVALGGFKNKVRNPKMEIAQRGQSFPAANGVYTLDGWRYFTSGAQVSTVSQQADVGATSECQYSLRVQVTTANAAPASGDLSVVAQNIEGFLVRDLLGNPIAIRFEVKSPKAGTHCVALRNSGPDRTYILTYTVTAANTWETKTLSLPGGLITAGTWNFTNGLGLALSFCLMAGTGNQTAAGSWQVGNFLAAAGQVNCMDTVGNVFAVTGVQVERDRGQGSSSLEHRDPSTEWSLNQRYFRQHQMNFAGVCTGAGGEGSISFYPPMRTAPTLSSVLVGNIVDGVSVYGVTSFSGASSYSTCVRITFSASGTTAGRAANVVDGAVALTSEL